MIAVYTNTIDYYYCTVVRMNSTKVVHVNTIIIVHKIVLLAVIAVYTNRIDYCYCTVVHMNSTEVVHTNTLIIVHKISLIL